MAMAIPYVIAAIGAASAYKQGQAQKQAAEAQARQLETERGIALQDQALRAQLSTGSAIAGYGAAGVAGDTGTPLDVLAFSAQQQTRDRLNIQYNYGSRVENLDREARNYGTSSILNAFSAGTRGYAQGISMFGSGTTG